MINDPGVFHAPDLYDPTNPNKGQQFYCWINLSRGGGHGPQRLTDAYTQLVRHLLLQSGRRLRAGGHPGMGPDKLAQWAQIFGISETNRLEIGGGHGFAPTPAWKRNTVWRGVDDRRQLQLGHRPGFPAAPRRSKWPMSWHPSPMAVRCINRKSSTRSWTARVRSSNRSSRKSCANYPSRHATLQLIQQSLFDVVDHGTARRVEDPRPELCRQNRHSRILRSMRPSRPGVCYNGMNSCPRMPGS